MLSSVLVVSSLVFTSCKLSVSVDLIKIDDVESEIQALTEIEGSGECYKILLFRFLPRMKIDNFDLT
jgi:hypothetical protein